MVSTVASELNLPSAEQAALGTFRSAHPPLSRMHKVNLAIASGFTLALLVPAVGLAAYGLAVKPNAGIEWAGLFFGGLGLLPLLGLLGQLRKIGRKLYLFENGFVYRRGRDRVVLWPDIRRVSDVQDVMGALDLDRRMTVRLADDTRFTLDNCFQDFRAFAHAVHTAAEEARASAVADAESGRRPVKLGPLLVSGVGIEYAGELTPWSQVERIRLEPNRLVIFRTGGEAWYTGKPLGQTSELTLMEMARGRTTLDIPPA